MKVKFITSSQSERLIIIFAGWAMDASPFVELCRPGYDIAVVWDYRSIDIDWTFAAPYSEICVVAWSLGVYAAAISTYGIESRVTRRIAVNGTLFPVDNLRGIPEIVFKGTLDGLNDRNLQKFYRRVAGSQAAFDVFATHLPSRDIAELRCELEAFYPLPIIVNDPIRRWDVAIICREDAIFPAANQWRAWQGIPVEMIDGAHLPDFQGILDRYIVDKQRVGERFACGRPSYDGDASVQAGIVHRLEATLRRPELLSLMQTPGARVLEIGSGTGLLSNVLDAMCATDAHLELWDLVGPSPVAGRYFRETDAELQLLRTPSGSFDLIVSASTIQWFNSPTRFFAECARILAPDGYMLVSTFARGNLYQVEAVTGRGLPLLSAEEWSRAAERCFSVEVLDCYWHTLEFDSALDVFRHLKGTGVNSLGRGAAGEGTLRNALKRYAPDLDGLYRASYRPVILLLKKK